MPIKADKSLRAYYNEIDKSAAQWLRNLMAEGWITKGDVDERSIEDVRPNDLSGYDRAHFFAGVGVWDYALNQAGWGRNEIWTGSCPCQPFSAAGKGGGFDDERHLWPAFHHLIKECHPAIVFGEQVASKAVEPWIDLVHTDLEALGYAFGCVPFPSAGVGAPHIRDRAYWVADVGSQLRNGARFIGARRGIEHSDSSAIVRLADTGGDADRRQAEPTHHIGAEIDSPADQSGGCGVSFGILGNAGSAGLAQRISDARVSCGTPGGNEGKAFERTSVHAAARPGPVNGFWRAADWLGCRDGKFRPVEPGTFPLVNGATSRVVRLRAYGNAINAKAAQAFIESVMEAA